MFYTPEFKGRVVDKMTGKPVKNVLVNVAWMGYDFIRISNGMLSDKYYVTNDNGEFVSKGKLVRKVPTYFFYTLMVRVINPYYLQEQLDINNEKEKVWNLYEGFNDSWKITRINEAGVNIYVKDIKLKEIFNEDIRIINLKDALKTPPSNNEHCRFGSYYMEDYFNKVAYNKGEIVKYWDEVSEEIEKSKKYSEKDKTLQKKDIEDMKNIFKKMDEKYK